MKDSQVRKLEVRSVEERCGGPGRLALNELVHCHKQTVRQQERIERVLEVVEKRFDELKTTDRIRGRGRLSCN